MVDPVPVNFMVAENDGERERVSNTKMHLILWRLCVVSLHSRPLQRLTMMTSLEFALKLSSLRKSLSLEKKLPKQQSYLQKSLP